MLITYYDYSNSIWSNTTLAAKVRHGHFKRLEIGPCFQLRFKNFQVQNFKACILKIETWVYFPNIVKRWKWNRHQNHRFWTFEKYATRACPWPKMIETPLGNSIWINFHVQILRFLRVISSRILWAKNHSILKSFEFFAQENFEFLLNFALNLIIQSRRD